MIRCSCEGDNPNCFKCDGKGWYDNIDLELPKYSRKSQIKPIIEIKPKKKRCPNCKKFFLENELNQHIVENQCIAKSKENNLMPTDLQKSNNKSKIKCSICNKFILDTKFKKHMLKQHGIKVSEQQRYKSNIRKIKSTNNKLIKTDQNKEFLTRCSICNKLVTPEELKKHIKWHIKPMQKQEVN